MKIKEQRQQTVQVVRDLFVNDIHIERHRLCLKGISS